jgi:aryl-alcohol dehydrogenase-like predicted oxidoreductase
MTVLSDTNLSTRRRLGKSDLQTGPLVLGGNVFGWTANEATSFALLDRFTDAGLNAVDTADVYSAWAPGNQGGESETIIGRWFKAKAGRRDKVLLITKVGAPLGPERSGLSANRILAAAEDSLRRLQTDRIDLYFSHRPDEKVPVEESLRAYERLIQQGKVRAIGASNYSVAQVRQALDAATAAGLPRYEVLQPEYNLYNRASFEGPMRDLAISEGLGVITYYSLASGFLSGKYRSKDDLGKSVRGGNIGKYLDARGARILQALDEVAKAHGAQPAEVALAWLIAREGVTAPIASATNLAQVESLIRATQLRLTAQDMELLNTASATT